MIYAWNDIEHTIANEDAALAVALTAAYSVVALLGYNSFNDECTYFVIRFDVHDGDARAAARVSEEKRYVIERAIRQHSQPWHSRELSASRRRCPPSP